jgi:hypothetical protein
VEPPIFDFQVGNTERPITIPCSSHQTNDFSTFAVSTFLNSALTVPNKCSDNETYHCMQAVYFCAALRKNCGSNLENEGITINNVLLSTCANKTYLSFFYTNIQSILNKMDELIIHIDDFKPDVIVLTETWLNPDIQNAEISITGYDIFRSDRQTPTKGGGLLLYVKSVFSAVEFPVPSNPFRTHESLWVAICQKHSKNSLLD